MAPRKENALYWIHQAMTKSRQKKQTRKRRQTRNPKKLRSILRMNNAQKQSTKKANTKKKTNKKPQEIAFDLENEQRPEAIDIATTSSTDGGDETTKGPAVKTENDKEQKNEEAPRNSTMPINATIRWEVEKAGPARVLDRKRVPTKRYGIDMISKTTADKREKLQTCYSQKF